MEFEGLSGNGASVARLALSGAERGRDARAVDRLTGTAGKDDVGKAAKEFEAVFTRMLLAQAIPEEGGGLFGEGPAAGIVRGLFVDRMGEGLAGRRALGIAEIVERSLERERLSTADGMSQTPDTSRQSITGA
jgi:Rod binding domain-containing protein